ncbi:MAG TPA: glycosyltransferase [Candidatus Paceibacterota bacterium]|nr:glycosyltransferase [Candidatus Paceibacterota bacterium]
MRSLSQLKVCFLAGTLGQGGAERQLFHILHALHGCGAALRVLCLRKGEFWEEPIKNLGVPVIHIGRATSKLGRLFRIVAELRRDRPQIIQSQHFFLNAYAAMTARMLGLVGIGALRSNGLMELKDCGRMGWVNLHAPHVLAANSQAAMQYATEQRVSPARLFFLANVVDAAGFRPAESRRAGPVRLISVGRLISSKRFDRFISLVAKLRLRLNCEINGIIVGDGPVERNLREQVAALGLPPSVIEFRGSLADLAPVYREADVFVMTSEYEGTPNVLLEAMASGLPVVSTNVGGVPEIIHPGQNGFLVDGNDDEDLCTVLERLIQDPELRSVMGRRGRAYVEARHSLEWLPVMLSALYELALANPQFRSATPVTPSHAH